MIIEVEALAIKRGLSKLSGTITVKNETTATAQIYVALKEIENFRKH